jgi:hypothetical protein
MDDVVTRKEATGHGRLMKDYLMTGRPPSTANPVCCVRAAGSNEPDTS